MSKFRLEQFQCSLRVSSVSTGTSRALSEQFPSSDLAKARYGLFNCVMLLRVKQPHSVCYLQLHDAMIGGNTCVGVGVGGG